MLLIKDLKEGETIYECEHGINRKMRILESPKKEEKNLLIGEREYEQWTVLVVTDIGIKIQLLQTENHLHYGPNLYYQPQY